MASDLHFVDGVARLSDGLQELSERIERGDPTYAFGALLLFQGGGGGLEGAVEEYVTSHWRELDAFTGNVAVVFVPATPTGFPGPRTMAQIIQYVKVPFGSLPCLWYFANFDDERVSYLPLADLVRPAADGGYRSDDVRDVMRAFTDLAWDLDHITNSRKRHEQFDNGMYLLHATAFPPTKKAHKLGLEHVNLGMGVAQVLLALAPLLLV